ncbi:hypothetical protein M407DRAFT_31256 [Tulasnella calospora MUT 4182]|uniref:separase n=1 Tax=Tulasnella calospora MUT 4182 TaxID=1051891 RepID=A0A0C3Q5X8_9AGAM|nr:hypothetical protein M407DRAFT_31256 [Tulasnella calospora MUT 4182]
MLRGPGFASACEYWTRFARFLNDVDLMTRISSLLGEGAGEDQPGEEPTAVETTETALRNTTIPAAQCCLILQRAATVLSSETDNGTEHVAAAVDVLPRCLILLTKGKEDEASAKGLFRALDEVGAACEDSLQAELKGRKTSSMAESATALLEGLVKLREEIVQQKKRDNPTLPYTERDCEDLLCGTLDGLFLLSKLTLRPKGEGKVDPTAVKQAYSHLQRAISLARITKDASSGDSSALPSKAQLRYAETLRSISAAFHNAAALLINGGKEAASASFWNHAAKIGQEALACHDSASKVPEPDGQPVEKQELEAWTVLRDRHIPSRLELLGYALARSGERRAAYDAYVRALSATPRSSLDKLVAASRSQPVRSVIQSEPKLAALLEKLTSLATYDLFLLRDGGADSGTLRRPLEQAGIPLEVVGTILEYQVLILDPVIHKEDAATAVRTLLKELKDIYSGVGEYPIRRARVLLRMLEYAYSMDDHNLAGSPMVVTGLLGTQNLGRDGQLSIFVPQYTLSLEILLTLQAHRRQDSEDKPTAIEGLTQAMAKLKVEVPQFHDIVLDDEDRFYRKLESLSNLLGLLGHVFHRVELLDIMRTLCMRTAFSGKIDSFVLTSVAIAQEYVKIGKLDRAVVTYEQAASSPGIEARNVSTEVRVIFLLRWAEALALTECTDEALLKYGEAMALSEMLTIPDKTAPTIVRARSRITALERSALAATVYGAIQLSRDNTTTAISGLMQALRLWNRALDTLTKLRQPTLPASSSEPNPFQVSAQDQTTSSDDKPGSPRMWDAMIDGLHWRLADGVVTTLFALGRLHYVRGSVKNSEFFTQRANELATSLNAPLLISRALTKEAEKELAVGRLDTGHDLLVQAAYHWEQVPDVLGPDLADLHRLQGNYSLRSEEPEEAKRIYGVASQLLDQLEKMFAETEASLVTPTPETASPGDGEAAASSVAPAVLASVLRQHIWLLRTEAGEDPMYDDLLSRFLALPPCVETKVEENALMGKLALEEVQARLEADLFLSSLTESAMALPMGMSSGEGIAPPTSTRDILASVVNAEKFFWTGLELSGSRGEVQQVREAALSLGLLRAFQTALGKGGKNNAIIAAALLDVSAAVTLRREMLECIDNKFPNISQANDLAWPAMNVNGSPLPASHSLARRLMFTQDLDEDDEDDEETNMQAYWQAVKKRYRSETLDAAGLASPMADLLPEHWTVVNISVTDDKQTLFISRQRARCEPLIFCLPLDRQGRREMGDDEEEPLTYEKAVEELQDIIGLNDETAKNAKDIQDKEGRAGWWAERGALDLRLKELLENIEFCWLGAFKTILAEPSDTSAEALNSLRTKIDKVFKRNRVVPQDKKSHLRLRLDDSIVECFSNLSPKCRDEEFEDLIYFLVVDLRTVLEEYSAKSRRESTTHPDHHLFLALDKNLQGLPWESIPILRGRSVSRIPSISFLLDRVDLVRHQQGQAIASRSSTGAPSPDRTTVDPLKTFYILNPSGDLKNTQSTFEPKFKDLEKLGWKGITGRPPTEEEMLQGFQKSDLMLYFGHAAGHQYIRSHKLRNLPRCAATMLWGCSSGALREMGDFERIGTPNHYMLAGCPTLVANLWDVTDREIDRVATAVMSKLRIEGEYLNPKGKNTSGDASAVSVVQAVAEARESCKLKYLTGAAPVVYGIPFYL